MSLAQVQTNAPAQVKTFGPGGQVYAANLLGGAKLVAGQTRYPIFDISESSPDIWARVLTNLKEAGKIGNSMSFTAIQYAPRFFKANVTPITAAELQALQLFIAGSRFEMYVGSNQTKVGEFALSHFLNIATATGANGAADPNAASLPINQNAWISLVGETAKGIAPNTEISAALICSLPGGTPAALGLVGNDPATPNFIFQWVIAGVKQVQ